MDICPTPLAAWAQSQLDALGAIAHSAVLPSAENLMRERDLSDRCNVHTGHSAKGGCRFYRVRDGWVALNLARPDDRGLLPALLQDESPGDLAMMLRDHGEAELVERGRMLGLAIAGMSERWSPSPVEVLQRGFAKTPSNRPKVVDLSSLWAGPLCSRLLMHCGAEVTRIDCLGRTDPLESSDSAHFKALNSGKHRVALDLRTTDGRARLLEMISDVDIVIEAARPRALEQMGIDANQLVKTRPGLVWLTITGHGATGEAANWVAFGDDAGVAAGLSLELWQATGEIGFVGDAIGDPLTGILAAKRGLEQLQSGRGARLGFAMSGIVAAAIEEEKKCDHPGWSQHFGKRAADHFRRERCAPC